MSTKPRERPGLAELLPLLGSDSLGYFFGRERTGDLLAGTLQQDSPLLVLGCVGSGKSLLLASLLRQLYEANAPERLQVTFIDPDQSLAPLFVGRPQTRRVAVRARDFVDALVLPFEEAGQGPYQLLVIDEYMWLAPHDGFRDQWPRFQETLAQLAGDDDLRRRVGLLATSIIGQAEINARFSSTIYIPQDFPLARQPQLEGDLRLQRLVRKYRGHFYIKWSGQDYRLFQAPLLSVSGPPSIPDLLWDRDRTGQDPDQDLFRVAERLRMEDENGEEDN
jgi:GTPase SAR1 family protein